MNNDANSKVGISTAKVIMDLANFIAFFLAGTLSVERLIYWQGHKKEMKAKFRRVLTEVFDFGDEFAEVRHTWEVYYKKTFQWTVDFSQVVVPLRPDDGDWRLIFVAKGMTCEKVYAAWDFPKWKNCGDDELLDIIVPVNIRTASIHYAVWVRADTEPDAEFLGKSTIEVDPDIKVGITLLEYMILQGKYFDETGGHLDSVGATFCSGSRSDDGSVPSMNSDRNGVGLAWTRPNEPYPRHGVRQVISS